MVPYSSAILAFFNFKKAIDACGAGLHVIFETTGWLCHCSGFWVQRSERALCAGRGDLNTKNTGRCVALFVTLSFAHEKPTHLCEACKGLHVGGACAQDCQGDFQKSHNLARYVARAHLRAPPACAYHFNESVA